MRRFALNLLLLGVAPLTAQTARVELVDEQLRRVPEDSTAWFRWRLERVDALAHVDLDDAMRDVEALWSEWQDLPGREGAAASLAALAAWVETRRNGVPAARVWCERAGSARDGWDPYFAAGHRLWVAARLCIDDAHADEVTHVVEAWEFARQSGFASQLFVASSRLSHVSPRHSLEHLEKLYHATRNDDRDEGAQAKLMGYMKPHLDIERADVLLGKNDLEGARQCIEAAVAAAERNGDRCGTGCALAARARYHDAMGDDEAAIAAFEHAEQVFADVRDNDYRAFVMDRRANHLIGIDRVSEAADLLARVESEVEGKGWRQNEHFRLRTRFALAVRMRDAETADELARALHAVEAVETEDSRRLGELRSELAAAEAQRVAMQEAIDAGSRRTLFAAVTAALLVVSGVLGMFWFGRRRLIRANAELSEQIERAEAAQRAKEEAEEQVERLARAESLGLLAAGVAHDFNNLLTGILGGADLLVDGHGDTRAIAKVIRTAGLQGIRLCRQLQDDSRGARLERRSVDLLDVVSEMKEVLEASVEGRLSVRIDADSVESRADVDRARIEQILLNLVQNASEAGAKTVFVRVAPAPEQGSTREVELCVSDDGRGMDPDVAERIFDPFFTTKFPGRGLGLSVVFSSVRRHGGRIQVKPRPEGGSSFVIRIPADGVDSPPEEVPAPREPVAPSADAVQAVAGTRILVVDDDPLVRKVLRSSLEQLQASVLDFDHGADALAYVESRPETPPSVLMVDLTMPDMDGDDVIRRLRQLLPRAHFVLMSGHAPERVEQAVAACDADDVLAKPFRRQDLARILALLVRSADA